MAFSHKYFTTLNCPATHASIKGVVWFCRQLGEVIVGGTQRIAPPTVYTATHLVIALLADIAVPHFHQEANNL